MVRGELRVQREAGQAPVEVQVVGDLESGEGRRLESPVLVDDPDLAAELLGVEDAAVRRELYRPHARGVAAGGQRLGPKPERILRSGGRVIAASAGSGGGEYEGGKQEERQDCSSVHRWEI